MNWLSDHLPHIATAAVAGAFTGTIDHCIARAEQILPRSLGELIKFFITRKPIRANNALECAPSQGGSDIMGLFDLNKLSAFVEEVEHLTGRLISAVAKVGEAAAPIAEAVAPLTGKPAEVKAAATLVEKLAPVAEQAGEKLEGASGAGDQAAETSSPHSTL